MEKIKNSILLSKTLILLSLVFTANSFVFAQKGGKGEAELHVAPAINFRGLFKATPPNGYYATPQKFRDSLDKNDRPGTSMNLGLQYIFNKNNRNQWALSLGYTHHTFKRVSSDIKIGTLIHPQVGNVEGLFQAPDWSIDYDYQFKYIELGMHYHLKLQPEKFREDFNMFFSVGASLNYLISQGVKISTTGFTQPNVEKNPKVDFVDMKGFPVNAMIHTGLRFEINVLKSVKAVLQPGFRLPLLPSSTGSQMVYLPQLFGNLGLVYNLAD